MTERTKRIPTTVPKNDGFEIPEIPLEFKGIIHKRKAIDPEIEWEEIRKWISSSPETIQDIRNDIRISADMSARSKDLYDLASIEFKKFKIKYRARIQLWRASAIEYWEKRKDDGLKKAITEQMIEDSIICLFESDYTDMQQRMAEIEALTESFKSLIETTYNKGVDLRKLLESEMKRPTIVPGWIDK